MGQKVSTGIEALDRRLGGGLEPGTLLAIQASPASQSDALMHAFVADRETTYVSTVRREKAVVADLERLGIAADVSVERVATEVALGNEFLVELTGDRVGEASFVTDTTALDDLYDVISGLDGQRTVVVDSTNPLERLDGGPAYRAVLNEIKAHVIRSGGIGILHCIELDDTPRHRETTLTLADTVWELELESVASGTEYHLRVPKNRGGKVINDPISVVLDTDVTVDNTQSY